MSNLTTNKSEGSSIYFLHGFILLLFLAQLVFAQQPTLILPDQKLTPGDTFDVTAFARDIETLKLYLVRLVERPNRHAGNGLVDSLCLACVTSGSNSLVEMPLERFPTRSPLINFL